MLTPKAIDLASNPNYAVVSTLLASGQPQSHVLWVDTDGTDLIINTVVGRRKHLNLLTDPRVTITIIKNGDWFDWVEVRGHAVEFSTGAPAWDHIEMLSERYFGGPFGGPVVERVMIRIVADRVVDHPPPEQTRRTRWETREGWYDHDLEFTGHALVYKQWFDSGKDPNRHEVPVHEFLGGRLHDEIREAFGATILAEVLETVESLTSGGPGTAEPPD